MRRKAYALINLPSLNNNLAIIKKIVGNAKVMAVIKADAYGHGMLEVSKQLNNVDAFSVACIDEALELRETGIAKPILALQGFSSSEELNLAIKHKVHVVVHHSEQIKILQATTKTPELGVYLKLDTGMHRLGISVAQFNQTLQEIKSNLAPASDINLMTHLARADEIDSHATTTQLEIFDRAVLGHGYHQSIANSAAIFTSPESHRDWVRPGLALYGVSPIRSGKNDELLSKLEPVMSLRAPIISIKQCEKGARIGYGGDYSCPRDMVIAIVAAGYADGYPRDLKGSVLLAINGQMAPLVGRVSMDMIAVDLSNMHAQIGDEVELWGTAIPVTQIADMAETISYELLCAAGNAVYKKYIK